METEKTIFHLAIPQAWQDAQEEGSYTPSHFEEEGFIHCSTQSQLLESAQKHFTQESELLVLVLPVHQLGDALKWETSRGGELFPHLYRPLNTDEVNGTFSLFKQDGGSWSYPPGHL